METGALTDIGQEHFRTDSIRYAERSLKHDDGNRCGSMPPIRSLSAQAARRQVIFAVAVYQIWFLMYCHAYPPGETHDEYHVAGWGA